MIERVGPAVDPSRVGERVWIWNGQWKRPFGTAATYIALPSEQAVRLPDGTTFEAGACLGIPALTAHRAVTIDVSPQGQSILVSGGAGAVGHYAIQFARLLGARPIIATVSSDEKAEHAKAAGADEVINYKADAVPDRVREDYRRPRRRSHRRSGYRRECHAPPEDHRARWALRGLRFKCCSGLF